MSAVNDIERLILCIVLFNVNCVNGIWSLFDRDCSSNQIQLLLPPGTYRCKISLPCTAAAVGTSGWMQKFALS